MISEEANMLKKAARIKILKLTRQSLKTIGRIGICPIPTCNKNAAALRIPIRLPVPSIPKTSPKHEGRTLF